MNINLFKKYFFHSAAVHLPYHILLIFIVCLAAAGDLSAYNTHKVFFENTDHELDVFRIFGEEPGKTLVLIGGIQGNEPGGYLAADRFVETKLKKGNLIVVPRANFYSILMNDRGINGDMNRKFDKVNLDDKDGLIIEKLKELIKESDFLLNLHDGSGFYSPEWKSQNRNPKMYGQSIIADCDSFYSKRYKKDFKIGEMAVKICNRVNARIKNQDHHFIFHNHRTEKKDTAHREQRKSLTYFALTKHQIPAFGIETSKSITSKKSKVRYQTMIVKTFMDEFGIVEEENDISLPEPLMEYLLISINNGPPVAVYNNEELQIRKGDNIRIMHAEVNYQRGVSVNMVGQGSINDLKRDFIINNKTNVVVKKDSTQCGSITIIPGNNISIKTDGRNNQIAYLIVMINNQNFALSPEECKNIKKGDTLKILDLIPYNEDPNDYVVNFKGFVGTRKTNNGEDRGYIIDTSKKLLVKYSKKGNGKEYTIDVTKDEKLITRFYVNILDPSSI